MPHQDIILDERDPLHLSPLEPYTPVEDDNMLLCTFDMASGSTNDTERNLVVPTMNPGSQRPRLIPFHGPVSSFEVLGAANHCRLISPNTACHYRLKSCVTLIHRQFPSGTSIHSLQFLPEYYPVPEVLGMENESVEDRRARVMKNIKRQTGLDESEIFSSKKGQVNTASFGQVLGRVQSPHSLRLLIGTGRNGYLYDVRDPRLLCEYSFTDLTLATQATSELLYTLTENCIIVWSMRPCSSAGERFPRPCVMGIEPIDQPRTMITFGRHLLVVPRLNVREDPRTDTVTAQEVSAPIQILHHKKLLPLFEEIREFALLNQQSSYEGYFQLMLELHFLLSAKLERLNQQLMETGYYGTLILSDSTYHKEFGPSKEALVRQIQAEADTYYEKYKESCAVLGDYHFRTGIFSRSSVFFSESDRCVSEVLRPMLAVVRDQELSSGRRAVINYLDAVLYDPDRENIVDETPELANRILALYYALARSKLASIILESSLSQYDQKYALELLQDDPPARGTSTRAGSAPQIITVPPLDGEEVLPGILVAPQSGLSLKSTFVRALLRLDLGQQELAAEDILSLEPEVLIEFCEQNPQLLLPDLGEEDTYDMVPPELQGGEGFQMPTTKPRTRKRCTSILRSMAPGRSMKPEATPKSGKHLTLGQLLYQIDPWPLLEVLVRIREYVPVSAALRLLRAGNLQDLSDEMIFLLECYLEWVLLESGFPCKEAFIVLLELYSKRVLTKNVDTEFSPAVTPPESKCRGRQRLQVRRRWLVIHRDSCISERRDWLNQIAPFDVTNPYASRSPFFDENEEPTAPYFYLQKLQGLLSLRNVTFPDLIGPLFERINSSPSIDGKLSLRLLCFPIMGRIMEAIPLVIKECPTITCAYATDYCDDNAQWRKVLEHLNQSGEGAVYREIISSLVRMKDPVAFLQLLPEDGNMDLFLPYIEQCFRLHFAELLKSSIAHQAKVRVPEK